MSRVWRAWEFLNHEGHEYPYGYLRAARSGELDYRVVGRWLLAVSSGQQGVGHRERGVESGKSTVDGGQWLRGLMSAKQPMRA